MARDTFQLTSNAAAIYEEQKGERHGNVQGAQQGFSEHTRVFSGNGTMEKHKQGHNQHEKKRPKSEGKVKLSDTEKDEKSGGETNSSPAYYGRQFGGCHVIEFDKTS